jgi:hypothetical protein
MAVKKSTGSASQSPKVTFGKRKGGKASKHSKRKGKQVAKNRGQGS